MESSDVVNLVGDLESIGVPCWLDGGWGVDALLGEQTRPHGDVDVVVPRAALESVWSLLTGSGFAVVRDLLPTALAFRHEDGREVDLHLVDPLPDGGGTQLLPDGGRFTYAAPVLGRVGGVAVRCSPAEDQLVTHQGYEPRPVDCEDVARLAQRFGLTVPASLMPTPPGDDGSV